MKNKVIEILLDFTQKNYIIMDVDCATSTGTIKIAQEEPASFLNMGICEQNAVGVAAGIAAMGLRPIISGFSGMLLFRAAEQIIHAVSYPSARVIILGHYSGFCSALEGAAHHCLNDLALMCSLPNFSVFTPSDERSLELCMQAADRYDGPSYIRLYKGELDYTLPDTSDYDDDVVELGDKTSPLKIISYGNITGEVVLAMEMLATDIKIHLTLLNRVKPLPGQLSAPDYLSATAIWIIEEHSAFGGLHSIVTTSYSGTAKVYGINSGDKHYSSGSLNQLRKEAGLTAAQIANSIRADCETL